MSFCLSQPETVLVAIVLVITAANISLSCSVDGAEEGRFISLSLYSYGGHENRSDRIESARSPQGLQRPLDVHPKRM